MQESATRDTGRETPSTGTVEPSGVDGTTMIANPVGFDFVMREIAERNPIVRRALMRRSLDWSG